MRNLGFEDTPDYDYLRDLFTQALKSTGEVEDGEYDWMKLNNGKGWEAMKHHPSQHLHATNHAQNPSNVVLGGGPNTQRGPATPGPLRLNSQQPLPPSPNKPGVRRAPRDRPSGSGGALQKRQSGAPGGLTADVATPTASTQAQFQSSTAHLPNNRMSTVNPAMGHSVAIGRGVGPTEEQPSAIQKVMKVLCCGNR